MNPELIPPMPEAPSEDSSAPAAVEARGVDWRYWARRLLVCNPFFLCSAALLLFGVNRLSLDPNFLGDDRANLFAQDSLFYQATQLGTYEVAGDWRRIDDYLPSVRAVTADDVVRVARAYLRAENRTTGVLIPDPPVSKPSAAEAIPQGAIH